MKKFIVFCLTVAVCCTALIATVQTKMRMHLFRNGDNGKNLSVVLSELDSVTFSLDTMDYKVTFIDWDGTELQSDNWQSGSMPEYDETKLNREQTAKYTYKFTGWKPDIVEVQKEATYTALYDSTIRKYAVVYVGLNGETLAKDSLNYGTMPNYNGETPTKENTKVYKYEFVWKPAMEEVTADAVYTMDFDSTKLVYTVKYVDYNGVELYEANKVFYDYKWTEPVTREEGSEYTYTHSGWRLDESRIKDSLLVYTAMYDSVEHGKLKYASFKVSDTTRVYFSKGNLQFNAMQGTHETVDGTDRGTWRFAENQWDALISANANISPTYTGWFDLFCWGTSGWNSGAKCYQPWATSATASDYCPKDGTLVNLTGDYAKADWGVYNAISNGGNKPNEWRTMTTEEWQYLFLNNEWTLGYIKTSETDSILCCFLIPDGFTEPSGVNVAVISRSLEPTDEYFTDIPSNSYASNTYTADQFKLLEKVGVVALPGAGDRDGAEFWSDEGTEGYYWSSSIYKSDLACQLFFYEEEVLPGHRNYSGYFGMSVRLVQEVR